MATQMAVRRVTAVVGCAILLLVLAAGCSAPKYVPKPNEELYGTWINAQTSLPKVVNDAQGFRDYSHTTDADPIFSGSASITSRWTDSDGNVWYKVVGTYTGGTAIGDSKGRIYTALYKLSKSATVMELMWTEPTND
jgi:hypothetical protein